MSTSMSVREGGRGEGGRGEGGREEGREGEDRIGRESSSLLGLTGHNINMKKHAETEQTEI